MNIRNDYFEQVKELKRFVMKNIQSIHLAFNESPWKPINNDGLNAHEYSRFPYESWSWSVCDKHNSH